MKRTLSELEHEVRFFARFATRLAVTSMAIAVGQGSFMAMAETLPKTDELTWTGDLAARMVDEADQFLLQELERSVGRRAAHWQRDESSPAAYVRSLEPQRKRLAHQLGLRDPRSEPSEVSILGAGEFRWLSEGRDRPRRRMAPMRIAAAKDFDVYAIQWPAFGHVMAQGVMLLPHQPPVANVVALPDCEVLPDQLAGMRVNNGATYPYATKLASAGCRVVIPLLINRHRGEFDWGARSAPDITNREMIYRSAFELGRGLIAYEVHEVLAAIDWMSAEVDRPVGVIGWGEGGLVALYAAALDDRIASCCVSGYFAPRERLWQEPIDRNVDALLEMFGDAELATMVVPRRLVIEAAAGPSLTLTGGSGAPAQLETPPLADVQREVQRARELAPQMASEQNLQVVSTQDGTGTAGSADALKRFLEPLVPASEFDFQSEGPVVRVVREWNGAEKHRQLMQAMDRHNQQILLHSADVRREFWGELDTSSLSQFEKSAAPFREYFRKEVIGHFEYPLVTPRPRTRRIYETADWRGYEVVLDVFENLFAYGILLVPKDLEPGERRPVVVCQHGLEGRPQDTVGLQGAGAYAGFAGELARRGFITFAPQNLYIGRDRFRTLQRKSYPLNKTLFSIIVPQHQQIVNWLKSLDYVDPDRVAFYGLSYGGKTAMRVPALVTDYCLSICSADFNEWVDKNASTTNPRSYVWTGEYEIFEPDLGSTFNYAEMARLIAPRPFMVERGHFDGVADDWTVAWEFAKVRHFYAARLGLADHCEIEWFVGPHQIHGVGTYDFLHRHLNWPKPKAD